MAKCKDVLFFISEAQAETLLNYFWQRRAAYSESVFVRPR